MKDFPARIVHSNTFSLGNIRHNWNYKDGASSQYAQISQLTVPPLIGKIGSRIARLMSTEIYICDVCTVSMGSNLD